MHAFNSTLHSVRRINWRRVTDIWTFNLQIDSYAIKNFTLWQQMKSTWELCNHNSLDIYRKNTELGSDIELDNLNPFLP